jgi:uncharacterized protein (TIGR02246 family)
MRKRAVVRFVAALVMIAGCSVESVPEESKSSSDATALSETDVAAVKAQVDKYVKATLARDWTAFGQTLAADVIAYPPNQSPIQGRDAVVAFVKTFPTITAFTVDVADVSGSGDFAYATGTFHLTMQMPDGSTVKDDGSFVEVHRRQADGSWPYTRLIWHSDAPLPTAPPAK